MMDFWIEHKDLHDEMMPKYAEFAKRFSLEKSIEYMLQLYDFILHDDRSKYVVKDYNNPMTFTLNRNRLLHLVSIKNNQLIKFSRQRKLMK